uniref:Uncharacterized protein n=1 Tax=Anguilla anguilla TaxID=7936 RepID=A0A0E9RHH9_ANGAN
MILIIYFFFTGLNT